MTDAPDATAGTPAPVPASPCAPEAAQAAGPSHRARGPKVSVIMPVYKVEAYVGRAIESVLGQTLDDLELLVVDDGSPDRSGEICDAYAARDPRVQVFHRENGGAPAARNYAIERARGEYLCFFDSDDWVEPRMLEDMYRMGHDNDLQLVISGFYIDTYGSDDPGNFLRQILHVPTQVFESQRQFREQAWRLFDVNQFYSPWNKLYRRDYVEEHHLRFPQTFWDDFPFVLSVIADVERVGVTGEAYYHFIRAREESETTRYRKGMYEKREEEHRWMLGLYEYWGVDDEDSREMIMRRYTERLVGCVENVTCPDSGLTRSQMRARVREIISTPHAVEAARITRPRSRSMALMVWPIRTGHPWLAYLEGRLISFVKRHFSLLFARLKAARYGNGEGAVRPS